MAASPGLKVFNPEGLYVAACKHAEDAACLVALYGKGATIRDGHNVRDVVWSEGSESQPAAESYDFVAETLAARIAQRPRSGRGQQCADCGEPGKLTGHMECQYPGRVSDRGSA